MKKVLVTALAVGVCVGAASTASADVVVGSSGKDKATSNLTAKQIKYAAEAYGGPTTVYTIPNTFVSFNKLKLTKPSDLEKVTLTLTLPPEIALQDVDTGSSPVLATEVTRAYCFVPGPDFENPAKGYDTSETATGAYHSAPAGIKPMLFYAAVAAGELKPEPGYEVNLQQCPVSDGDEVIATLAGTVSYTGNSIFVEFAPTGLSTSQGVAIYSGPDEATRVKIEDFDDIDASIPGFMATLTTGKVYKWAWAAGDESKTTVPLSEMFSKDTDGVYTISGISNIKFLNQNGEMGQGGYQVNPKVKVELDKSSAGQGVAEAEATIAEVVKFLETSGYNGHTSIVDSKSDLLNFVERLPDITTTRAYNGKVFVNTLSGEDLYLSDGELKFGAAALTLKLDYTVEAEAFPKAVTDVWMDINGNNKKDDGESMSPTGNSASIEFAMNKLSSGKGGKVYVDVNGTEMLPHFLEFNAAVGIVGPGGETISAESFAGGTWGFNGTVLQIPRFEIKGAKCNATLTNTSGRPAEYFAEFFTTEKGMGTEKEGDLMVGTIPASGTLNIPCNKIIKKVKGNQGTLQFVVKEKPEYITGTYQAAKGSSISNDSMTPMP